MVLKYEYTALFKCMQKLLIIEYQLSVQTLFSQFRNLAPKIEVCNASADTT